MVNYLPHWVAIAYAETVNANLEVGNHVDAIVEEIACQRHILIEVALPFYNSNCSVQQQCAVAFLSAGYRVPRTNYTFLARQLSQLNYMVIASGHELPGDPPLSKKGNLYETRSENWTRGARTIEFLKNTLAPK